MAAGFGQGSEREHLQGFFIRLGARYRCIRKRPKGKPSPQLYAYKSEKLQELVKQEQEDLIDLYYGDESHICTEGYVPYGPHLNIAETLWRILKGKWLKPVDYISTDSLLYATNRALAALGTELNINFAHVA